VVVTGSHNPPEYNGLKVVLSGETLSEAGIQGLHERLESGNLLQGDGTRQEQDLIPDYIGRIVDDVRLAKTMKVVVDCGNGAASDLAPQLFRTLGCEVIDLFCEVDGDFPNHHPDPSDPDNLQSLILEVQAQGADIGLAFDGDGDRLGVVDGDGNIIWPDRLLMVLAADVLSRQPGSDIIYDVKCSRYLASEILAHGGRPLMWKTGHSILKSKLKETGALLAGEFSGHIAFKERWFGFDDALYAAARLLEILSVDVRSPTEVFAELPQSVMTPELKVTMEEGRPHEIMRQLMSHANLPGAKVTTLDGLRAEFEVGWGLVRASNTGPARVFRFEAESEAGLVQIQKVFRGLIARVAPDLELPFS
jgi:phosphomannomutase/phosphoglucomutase